MNKTPYKLLPLTVLIMSLAWSTSSIAVTTKGNVFNINNYVKCNKLWNKNKKSILTKEEAESIKKCNQDFKWIMFFSEKHPINFSTGNKKEKENQPYSQIINSFYDFFMIFSDKKTSLNLRTASINKQLRTIYKKYNPLDYILGKEDQYNHQLRIPRNLSFNKSSEYEVPNIIIPDDIDEIDLLPPVSIAKNIKPNYSTIPKYTMRLNKPYQFISKQLISAISQSNEYQLMGQKREGRIISIQRKEQAGPIINLILKAKDKQCILFAQDKKFYLYSLNEISDIIEKVQEHEVKPKRHV